MTSSPALINRASAQDIPSAEDASPSADRAGLANDDDRPWYASLDSIPESRKFNSGHHSASAGCVPGGRRSSSFAHSEIEKVKQEDLDVADDIPAVWPTQIDVTSRPSSQPDEMDDPALVDGVFDLEISEHDHRQSNTHHRCPSVGIPIAQLHNHFGREVSRFETPPATHPPCPPTAPRHANRRSIARRRSSLEHELMFPVEVGQPTQRQKGAARCSRPEAALGCGEHVVVVSGGGKAEVCHCSSGADW
ncbi:hypothetical protein LTR36_000013 [Oleoguttula mirabilis]|uniref:Uncharacterized protein n=1 Tax=Oleoguttula mirabilis TaxID=1507867 RepID=A0AAV9JXN1_9PEZI|nr:hypothetical protein LTR36_000013 [Oleoguttula mirabilis]